MKTQSSTHHRRRHLLSLALLPVLGVAACSSDKSPAATETVRPAYVAVVGTGATDALGYIGEVRAARRAELAFPVPGRVSSVAVEIGDSVRPGQVLATLDLQPLKAQLAMAQGDLARAEAQVAELRQRAERVRRAQAAGATSGGEASGTLAELAAAEASLRAASAQRDAATWSVEQATLRAPVAGVVATRLVEPGQAAGPGAPVLVIDGEGRELSLLLPSTASVKAGQDVLLRNASGSMPTRVLRVAGRLEAGGVRRVFLAAPQGAAVGSTWTVYLPGNGAGEASLRVPLRAVLPDAAAGSGRVLRLGKDGRTVEQVEVKLGALHGDTVEVSSGLANGDRVIVAGAAGIRPGSLVKPVAYRGEVKP